MTEQTYFEQFTGDETDKVEVDTIPAFSVECPECHGTGFASKVFETIQLESPCYRCWTLVGR